MKKTLFVFIFILMAVISQDLLAAQPSETAIKKDSVSEDLDYLEYEDESVKIADPLYVWNKAMFEVNDRLYFWILKPVAQGYKAVIPEIVRKSIKNFFRNLKSPRIALNSFLQGKMEAAASETGRFLYNSIFGIAGFLDLAKDSAYLNPPEEDFGQTLAFFGIGNGLYIVWPFLGPSTLRDTIGMGGDYFLNLPNYLQNDTISWSLKANETINDLSFRIGDYEDMKDAAIDPYESLKDIYIQYRYKNVNQ